MTSTVVIKREEREEEYGVPAAIAAGWQVGVKLCTYCDKGALVGKIVKREETYSSGYHEIELTLE